MTPDGEWEEVDQEQGSFWRVALPPDGTSEIVVEQYHHSPSIMFLMLYEAERGYSSMGAFVEYKKRPIGGGRRGLAKNWTPGDFQKLRFNRHAIVQFKVWNRSDTRQTIRMRLEDVSHSRFDPSQPNYSEKLCMRRKKQRDRVKCLQPVVRAAALPTIATVKRGAWRNVIYGVLAGVAALAVWLIRWSVVSTLFPTSAAQQYRRGLESDVVDRSAAAGYAQKSLDPLQRKQDIRDIEVLRRETQAKIAEARSRLDELVTPAKEAELRDEETLNRLREELEATMAKHDRIKDELQKKIAERKKRRGE